MSGERTALCLGGGDTLRADLEAVGGPWDGVVACNEAGIEWPGELDAWVSLHRDKFNPWRARRRRRGFPPARLIVGSPGPREGKVDLVTEDRLPGMHRNGSSGLFAVKVALVDLGFDRAILCGIPLTRSPHFFGGQPWAAALGYRRTWAAIPPEFRARMRSMSGWTRVLLGGPADWARP